MSARSVSRMFTFASTHQRNACVNRSSARPSVFQGLVIAGILTSMFVSEVALADNSVVTHYSYDTGDNVATVTDPRGLITSYIYDGLGQHWSVSSPDTGVTTYAYDSYGRLAGFTRSNGVQTSYGYDAINRPISISAGGQTQTFTYDSCNHGLGRLCSASDTIGTTSYSYTPEGWITGRGFSIAGTTYALGYSYDAVGHLVALSYPDGNQAVYNYVNGAVTSVTFTQGGSSVSVASNVTWQPAASVLASWTSSNGLVNTLSYDTDGRLTAINVPGVQGLSFVYDTADRIVGVSNAIDSTMSQNYGYDEQSRLVSVYSSQGIASYAYDADGNRIATTENGASSSTSYGATSNHITSTTGANPLSYGYDALGNITTLNGTTTYQYDSFNRMASAGGMSYYVGPEGQRLRKMGAAGTTYFAPDIGGAPMAEYLNGSWIDYLWLGGRLIGREVNGGLEAIHDDQTGRPQVVTSTSGAVVWNAQNGPFSRTVTLSNTTALNVGFPGQYYDQETGLWNNGFRDYDPTLGRYVESDPIGLDGGINTYAYVGNNPLSDLDPFGLATICYNGKALTDFSKSAKYLQMAASYINAADSLEDAAFQANTDYSKMASAYHQTGVWTQDLEDHRSAEHYMFALYWGSKAPVLSQVSLILATPLYSLAKIGGQPKSTPPSFGEIAAGYKGVIDSTLLLPGSEYKIVPKGCGCD